MCRKSAALTLHLASFSGVGVGEGEGETDCLFLRCDILDWAICI